MVGVGPASSNGFWVSSLCGVRGPWVKWGLIGDKIFLVVMRTSPSQKGVVLLCIMEPQGDLANQCIVEP